MAKNGILYKKSQKKAEILKELSPHLFWNIDVSKLDIKKIKKQLSNVLLNMDWIMMK